MIKKNLLDVLFKSEKRKNVLILLQDGPKDMKIILDSLKVTRQSLLPQMKILEEHYLISHYGETYELTTIGKQIVDKMLLLLNTTEVFNNGLNYWGTRDLDFIPSNLLEKIGELKNCEIISPSIEEIFSIHRSFNPDFKVSPVVYIVTTILYPDADLILADLLKSGNTVNYIASRELLDKIRKEYRSTFSNFVKHKNFNMYVYNKKMEFLYFTFDSVHTLICMLKNNGEFDHKFMLCRGDCAINWTKELYDHCLKDSTAITEI